MLGRGDRGTYSIPIEKAKTRPIRFVRDICNRQTVGNGSTRVAKRVTTLIRDVVRYPAVMSEHVLLGML